MRQRKEHRRPTTLHAMIHPEDDNQLPFECTVVENRGANGGSIGV
jgi:hypothetical protein